MVSVLKELGQSGILFNKGDCYSFSHETVRRTIFTQIPQKYIKPISIDILKKIESDKEIFIDKYVQLKLNYQAEDFDQFHEQALLVALDLQNKGNIDSSNEVFSMMRNTLQTSNHTISNQIVLGEITNNLLIGNYGSCLETLRELRVDEAPSILNIKLDLLESKCYLRLNQYFRSFTVAARIPKSQLATIEDKIDALRTINTLYRDMGQYSNAERVADRIYQWFEKGNINPALESKVYRTMARTYALSGKEDVAIKNATAAVKSAKKFKSVRDLANAYLAEGESYRHANQIGNSIPSYNNAIDFARSTGNIDCLLWSTLGLSDAHLLNNDISSAEKVSGSIAVLLESRVDKHPIEYLHWNLTKYSIDYIKAKTSSINLKEILCQYNILKVKWPIEYIKDLHASNNRAKTY